MRDNLSNRPKIDVPKTHWDYMADALAIIGILLGTFLLLVTWADFPDRIFQAHPGDLRPLNGLG